MKPDSDDDAWRAIVDNYGERANLGTDAPSEATPEAPQVHEPAADPRIPEEPVELASSDSDEGRFVPGSPELPSVTPDRLVAWIGLFGSPAILLLALVLGLSLPGWLGYLLVAWFVGGFLYLVAQMPAGPRDPGDDGARL